MTGNNLHAGKTSSCGCARVERIRESKTTHGLADSPTYRTWYDMIRRCEDSRHADYEHYGGRGIRVCERWHNFAAFLEDIKRPQRKALIGSTTMVTTSQATAGGPRYLR